MSSLIFVPAACYRAEMVRGAHLLLFLSLFSGATFAAGTRFSWDVPATCGGRLLAEEAKAALLESIATRLYQRLRHYNLVGPILDQTKGAGIAQFAAALGAPLTSALYEALCPTVTLHLQFHSSADPAERPYVELYPRFHPARFTGLRSRDMRVMISYALDEKGEHRGVTSRGHVDALLHAAREARTSSSRGSSRSGWAGPVSATLSSYRGSQLPGDADEIATEQAAAWDVVTAGVWSDVSAEERTAAVRILFPEELRQNPSTMQQFAREAAPLLRAGTWTPRILGAQGSLGFFLPGN